MIICCGEALVDMLPSGQHHTPVLGGSIFNTARVCGRLGLKTAYIAPLSTDAHGDSIAQSLMDSGVSLQHVQRVDRPTALAWVSLHNGQAQYRFEVDGSASQMVTRGELPAAIPDCTLAHFGSISLADEPCATAYSALMQDLSDHTMISIDPNIRPAFIRDRATQLTRFEQLFAMADIIKLSDEDLSWFEVEAGSPACDAFAESLLKKRTLLVVVTRGSAGVTGYSRQERMDVPALDVEVTDTIGAGDAFSAGLYHGIHSTAGYDRSALSAIDSDTLGNILSSGVRVSAQVVQHKGAELSAGFRLDNR